MNESSREQLAAKQREVLAALKQGQETPEGFDDEQLAITRGVLDGKRRKKEIYEGVGERGFLVKLLRWIRR